jgi:hypothetical protein
MPGPTKPAGTECKAFQSGGVWYSHNNIDCAPVTTSKTFPKVAILGGGIAGLTVAYEMVQAYAKKGGEFGNEPLDITVYEKNSYPGGKIVGYFLQPGGRPIEHSTRIYGINYIALFDVLQNVPSIHKTSGQRFKFDNGMTDRCVLDDLVPMAMDYVSAKTYEHNYTASPSSSAYDETTNVIKLLTSNGVPSSEVRHIISKFQDFFSSNYQQRLALTAGLTIGQYLEYSTLGAMTQSILTSYVGIIVAARVQCDGFAIMSLFEALGMFGSPKTTPELRDSGLWGGNCFPGPSSKYFIDPLYAYLVEAGVQFKFNTTINSLDDDALSSATAVVLALPHMVAAKMLGPSIFPPRTLHNEWSFGMQFYVTDMTYVAPLLGPNKNQQVYSSVLGSPWQIIYTLEYSKTGGDQLIAEGRIPFWGTHDMGEAMGPDGQQHPILATITATVSNQYNYGLWVGKPALMCTPDEMLTEVLVQVGIRDANALAGLLAPRSSFGSILYMEAETATAPASPYSGAEWMHGPVQPNGYQWISEYTLFITTPNEPTFASRGVCGLTNMYGNFGCTDFNNLPGRLNQQTTNARMHYLGLTTQPAGADAPTHEATFDPLPDRHYLAGEYCATPNLHIPTMEKACESGKVVAQSIIADFGITDAARQKAFIKGDIHIKAAASLENSFAAASVLVQVNGLQRTTDLVAFRTPSLLETAHIAMYTGFHIGYPRFVAPTVITMGIVLLGAIAAALSIPLTRRHRRHVRSRQGLDKLWKMQIEKGFY